MLNNVQPALAQIVDDNWLHEVGVPPQATVTLMVQTQVGWAVQVAKPP
jgi:hypothetical protein